MAIIIMKSEQVNQVTWISQNLKEKAFLSLKVKFLFNINGQDVYEKVVF